MGGVSDFVGDVVGGVGDVVGSVGGAVGDVVGSVGDAVGNLDIEDAAKTYIMSGGNPYAAAFAATDYDEKLGFNPASFYNPTTGGFGFDTGNSFVAGDNPFDKVLNQSVSGFTDLAKIGIDKLASYAQSSPDQAPQYAETGNKVVQTMGTILQEIAAGKYSKSPASEFNTRSVMAAYYDSPDSSNTAGLLADYNKAKTKVNSIITKPSNMGKLAINDSPFYNFLQKNKVGFSQNTQPDIFKPYLEKQGLI
tara:strand:+ start:643 stop:1392 length:750 start_codon:yes stop_codon:yes gene_type:complete